MNRTCGEPAPEGTRFDLASCLAYALRCDLPLRLSYEQVRTTCGIDFSRYRPEDVPPAIISWVVPLFVLLANMHFIKSSLSGLQTPWDGRDRGLRGLISAWLPIQFDCSSLLANPVNALLKLSLKLDLGQQLFRLCRNSLRGVLSPQQCCCVANLCHRFYDFGAVTGSQATASLLLLLNDEENRQRLDPLIETASKKLNLLRYTG